MPAINSRTVSAVSVIALGDAAPDTVATWVVQVSSLSGTFAITPKCRVIGTDIASGEYATLSYKLGSTGALTAGTTPIAAEGIYFLPCDGLEVFLDVTAVSASFRLDAQPVRG